MKPTFKEKWVINRLKKQGYKDDWQDYSEEEKLIYKPLGYYNQFEFCISRKMGCYMKFRPNENPALHLTYYFSWPNTKNWHEIQRFEDFCLNNIKYDNFEQK